MGERVTPEQLSVKLGKAGENVRKRVEKGVGEACMVIVDEAKRNCTPGSSPYDSMIFPSKMGANGVQRSGAPFDTGALRRSITSSVSCDDKTITASIGTNMEYARHVHEGTSRMQGRPFITDAINAKKTQVEQILKNAGAEALKETCGVEAQDNRSGEGADNE